MVNDVVSNRISVLGLVEKYWFRFPITYLKSNSFLSRQSLQYKAQHRSLTWSWVQKACPQATGVGLLVRFEGRIDVEYGLLNGNIHQPVRTEKHFSHYSTLLHCRRLQGNMWRDATTHHVRPTGFLFATQDMLLTMQSFLGVFFNVFFAR